MNLIHKSSRASFAAISAAFFCLATAFSAAAHEYWIEPLKYEVALGDTIQADLKNGQNFAGNVYSYVDTQFVRFDVTNANGTMHIKGELGDVPAVAFVAKTSGLQVLSYQSNPDVITYRDAKTFRNFADYEGLNRLLEKHTARGLPEKNFKEAYTRFSKALVSVGKASGKDSYTGMRFEFIALNNPYLSTANGGMHVQLLLDGKPTAGMQVGIFQKRDKLRDERIITRTDEHGVAFIARGKGGEVLLSAVTIEEPSAQMLSQKRTKDAVWHSLWAALNFKWPQ